MLFRIGNKENATFGESKVRTAGQGKKKGV